MPYPTTMLIDDDPSEADHHTPMMTAAADEDDNNSTSRREEYVAEIRRTLLAAFTPVTYVGITDVTDGHTVEGYKDGRALAAHGHELLLLLVTPVFDQVALLQRQRMIHKVLHGDLQTGHLHSIRMKCFTPAQWMQKGQPPSFHHPPAPCVMNMKNMAVLVRTTPKTEDTTTTTTTDDETTLSSSSCASSTTEEAADHEEDCDCFEEHDTHSDTASSSSSIPPARMVARLRGHSRPSTSTMSSSSMCACGDYSL